MVQPDTVRRAQSGDATAREQVALVCQRHAYLFALQLTGSRDEALDVAQDALLRFFGSLGRFDASRPLRPWLLRIVRNLVRDRIRRRRVRRSEPLQSNPEGLVIEPVDPAPSPEERSAQRELQVLVWQALLELPPQQQEVVALRDYLDLSYDEIAVVLKIPRGTVMSRLHRARLSLRASVAERVGTAREVPDA
jgi:RNA polymerase sigma-70 factor (ECF subfamily)